MLFIVFYTKIAGKIEFLAIFDFVIFFNISFDFAYVKQ